MENDLISRKAAIDALGEEPELYEDPYTLSDEYSCGRIKQWQEDVEAITRLPSIQSERKKGKWIFETGPKPRHMYCSECGARYIPSDEWEMWKGNCDYDHELPRNFCSQCGADMRGGIQNDECHA